MSIDVREDLSHASLDGILKAHKQAGRTAEIGTATTVLRECGAARTNADVPHVSAEFGPT
jgi:hypothetical protein